MEAKSAAVHSDLEVGQRLKEVEIAAKKAAGLGTPRKPPEVVMDRGDETAAGRRKLKVGEKWDVSSGKESAVGEKVPEVIKTDEERDVELQLNTILKRSPSEYDFALWNSPFTKKSPRSHHILQVLLSFLEKSQGYL